MLRPGSDILTMVNFALGSILPDDDGKKDESTDTFSIKKTPLFNEWYKVHSVNCVDESLRYNVFKNIE